MLKFAFTNHYQIHGEWSEKGRQRGLKSSNGDSVDRHQKINKAGAWLATHCALGDVRRHPDRTSNVTQNVRRNYCRTGVLFAIILNVNIATV